MSATMNPENGNRYYSRMVVFALMLAGVISYGRTLPYPFAFDCWTYIQNNPLITDLKFFSLLTDSDALSMFDAQRGLPRNVATDFMLRPLTYLTLSVNYLLHGLNPAGFRAVNVALHIFNAIVVYLFLQRLLTCSSKAGQAGMFSVRFIPTFSAMLFLLHPLQIESVTYIIQRSSTLMASCCLVSLWTYLLFVTRQGQGRASLFRWVSLAALFSGMFVKESMVTVPLLLLLLEMVCLGSSVASAVRRTLPHLCLMPIVPLLVLAAGRLEHATAAAHSGVINIINYSGYSPAHYVITQLCVVSTYLRLLLLPYGQNIDPDYPLYSSLLQLRPLASLALLALMLAMAIMVYRRRTDDARGSLLLFGVGWFFLGLSASSSIVPLPDLMAESRVYCSSIGFFIVFATLLDWLRDMRWAAAVRQWVVPAALVMVVAYAAAAWARNGVWSSNITLWRDATAKSPKKERAWHNLGMACLDEGHPAEAITCFRGALDLNPTYILSYEALVTAYTRAGRTEEAKNSALAGLKIAPRNAVLHNNLGAIYAESGQADTARQFFEKALQLRPGYESARLNLERLNASQGK